MLNVQDEWIGYLLAIIFNTHVELYDFCILPQYRSKGYGKRLLQKVLDQLKVPVAWLGVRLDNPDYKKVVSLYANLGFKEPMVTYRTLADYPIGFPVLGMTYYRFGDFDPRETIDLAMEFQNERDCEYKLIIPRQVLVTLNDFLGQDDEIGGAFRVAFKRGEQYVMKLADVRKGDFNNVSLPDSYFTFHTHPLSCYRRHGCSLGWPSGQDMGGATFLRYFNNLQLGHIVVTREGLYYISLTPAMMRVVNHIYLTNPEEGEELASQIKRDFVPLEEYRKTLTERETIENYFEILEHYTIHRLLEKYENETDKVFNVQLISWKTLERLGDLEVTILGIDSECILEKKDGEES